MDSSLAFLREGYAFVSNRCRRLGTDVFETRLAGRPTTCMLGAEAARVFYEQGLTRRGALPRTALTLLQDEGSALTLDDEPHRHRKALFLEVLSRERARELAQASAREWERAAERWERAGEATLLPAVEELLCRAVCAWAGIDLDERQLEQRTRELAATIDGAGSVGPRNVRGQLLRQRTERWARRLVRDLREGDGDDSSRGAPAARIACWRDLDGRLLDEEVAAVELINVLRPTVAVARYVVFAAAALQSYPAARDADTGPLAQEVRRFYPFFPAVAGVVREEFAWHGHRFPAGRRVLLDVYGTNRDPRLWDEPDTFRPTRFEGREVDPFTLIPQGGGDHATGHRCAGEWVTIELLQVGIDALRRLRYDVPPQDLRIRLSRMPAQPESGFRIANVRRL